MKTASSYPNKPSHLEAVLMRLSKTQPLLFLLISLFAGSFLVACSNKANTNQAANTESATSKKQAAKNENGLNLNLINNLAQAEPKKRSIYLAGGCFWGVEEYVKRIPGVLSAEAGYAQGKTSFTTYEEVKDSDHAETVKVVYDANRIHLAEILDRYYRIIDPLSLNRQGNDVGRQYRIGIYYESEKDLPIIQASVKELDRQLGKKSVIEVEAVKNYVKAEDYHQDYLEKNPLGYCHINLNAGKELLYPGKDKPTDEELKKNLASLAYIVTQKAGTEPPGTSALESEKRPGIYVDVVTGQPLFSSQDKYDSGCGWPSFTQAITTDALAYSQDKSFGMNRVEARSSGASSHEGHVFEDGPAKEGGLRFCINGASLRFIPQEEMEKAGYSALLPYVIKRAD